MLMARRFRLALAVLAVPAMGLSVLAEDYDADFALRLPAALTRFAGYADVAAGGNASAASKWSTSINPAATAWLPATGKCKLSLTPQFSALDFEEGTRIYVTTESILWQSPRWGSFLPAAAQVWSSTDPTSFGLDFEFDSEIYQLQWGIKPADRWAIGANLSYSDSNTEYSLGGFSAARTESESVNLRVGGLYQLAPKWRLGAVAEYGGSRNDNRQIWAAQYDSTTEQFVFRPGVCWEYAPDSSLYLDYQMVLLSDSKAGHLDLHRFATGIDHQLIQLAKGLFVRAGAIVDTRGQFGWTCGGGFSPASWVSIDLAYQHDFFPELAEELGQAQTFTVSVSFAL
jgi:hypothetical protein